MKGRLEVPFLKSKLIKSTKNGNNKRNKELKNFTTKNNRH
jgi:hypothetical protein